MPLIARLADLVKVLHNLLVLSGRTDRNGNRIDPSDALGSQYRILGVEQEAGVYISCPFDETLEV